VDQALLLNLEENKGDAKKSLKIAKSEMDSSIFMVPKAIEAYNEASEILKGSKYEANMDCVDAGRVASVESIQTKTGTTFKNSIGMEFVQIPAGSFEMGCSEGDTECLEDEKPKHKVKIAKSFYMGKYEVTQGQWMSVMGSGFFGIGGNNPSRFSSCGHSCPVENVSWNEVQDYIQKLCEKEKMNPCKYRLPTEAEWEYSARAGTKSKYYWGNKMDNSYLWYAGNSGRQTHPVGQKKPNAWGLYDIMGNVWEWCGDWYGEEYYKNSPSADPKGADKGLYRSFRGGYWFSNAWNSRLSFRNFTVPVRGDGEFGFRLVLLP